jgi:hypothetical protein
MDWYVQFRRDAVDDMSWHPTQEDAIEAACRLIDVGIDVFGLGTGPLTDAIGPEYINRLYQLWAREKYPFGRATTRD